MTPQTKPAQHTPSLKPKPVFRIEIKSRVGGVSVPELRVGQVIRTELLSRGTNWIKIRIPGGAVKTLFNFEADWRPA